MLDLNHTKLGYHYDRVQAWDAGERIAPVSCDLALTRACQAACRGCYAQLQEAGFRHTITVDVADRFLDDCARMGVRGLSLVSDGESTVSKTFIPFVFRAAELGIDVGLATNGWLLTPDKADQVLPHLKWVRFTVLAGRPESYVRMMYPDPTRLDIWETAMANITHAVQQKQARGWEVTLGIQTFLQGAEDAEEILPFAQLGVDLGVDYALIKHMSDDEQGSLGVRYGEYDSLYDLLYQAEGLSNERTQVTVRWSKIQDRDQFPYQQVYGPQFLLQISGSGLLAPAGQFFNRKFAKFWIGDFTQESFYALWRSDRYWAVMDYLASPLFNAQQDMGTLPIQHLANIALDRHKRGVALILPAQGEIAHRNFV